MIALDIESSGIDFHHGAKPFLVTICDEQGNNSWYEWDVDSLTREPEVPDEDLKEIQDIIDSESEIVFHNPKFDIRALGTIGINDEGWDWSKTQDSLMASHILASDQPHDLTSLSLIYLGLNVKLLEDAIEEATQKARRIARSKYKDFMIAKKDLPCMPSAKEKVWKADMWLPRVLAAVEDYEEDHSWFTMCSEYANSDTFCTVKLFEVLRKKLEEKDLWGIYLERMKILPILYGMESNGITVSKSRMTELQKAYQKDHEEASDTCLRIALEHDYDLELPKGSKNQSLTAFIFDEDKLNIPVIKTTPKGNVSLDKGVKEAYELTLEGEQLEFMLALNTRSKISTSLSYMESYEKFGVPHNGDLELFASVNPTGTHTLRMSYQNPNLQQVSKKTDKQGRTLRYAFGPAQGREWWSLDYDNLELRIPAYECREPAMLELFENPEKGPYFGSYHLLIAHILYKKEFESCKDGPTFKEKYPHIYGWVKNGNFAELYGAMDRDDGQGTADKAYHKPGAQRIIASRLTAKNGLNDYYIKYASKHGFVESLPDKTVNPDKGYPLLIRKKYGKVMPTLPLNYHVQGTACWIMMRAMVKVQEYLNTLGPECRIALNVHDEIVLDFPFRKNKRNLPKIRTIRRLMESIGDDLIPQIKLTCGVDYHPKNWSECA